MVHLWQSHAGSPGRRGYHSLEWAMKMEEVGLVPSNTGQLDGEKTGEPMTHYIQANGLFDLAYQAEKKKKLKLNWESRANGLSDRNKLKLICPVFGLRHESFMRLCQLTVPSATRYIFLSAKPNHFTRKQNASNYRVTVI
jgi:hypothetical protein